jgi:IS5 family transposase
VTGACEPVRLRLTAGQRRDMVEASAMIQDPSPEYVIADKGYDSAELRKQIRRQKAQPVIRGRMGTRRATL